MIRRIITISKHHRGIAASSYGLLVGLIGVVALAAISSTGSSVNTLFDDVGTTLNEVASEPSPSASPSASQSPDQDPLGLAFTDQTDVATSTQIMSNIVQLTDHNGLTVTITGGDAEFRTCNDSGCSSIIHDWGNTGQSMNDGEYLQVRVTSSASDGTAVDVDVMAGNATDTWSVTTTANLPPVETQNWATSNPGTGFGGIDSVRFETSSYLDPSTFRMTWPIVSISGTNISSGTYSLHAGCGNQNGQDGCNAVCITLGFTGMKSGWDVPCGSGYPSGASSYAATCVYKQGPISSGDQDWVANYGNTGSCGNPMNWCDCQVP